MVEIIEARLCPCQYGPERRPEIFVEGDIHCIEVGGILLRADAGRSGHHIQPCAVQVGRNALRAAVTGERYHVLIGHDLAMLAAYRALDHDGAHSTHHSACYGPLQDLLQFGQGEGRAARCQRYQVDATESWHTVTRVIIEMTLFWHDRTRFCATQPTHRQVVGQGTRGHEDGRLLAQHLGAALFEPFDRSTTRKAGRRTTPWAVWGSPSPRNTTEISASVGCGCISSPQE